MFLIRTIILVMPQLHDLKSTNLNHKFFFSSLNNELDNIIDMTETFQNYNNDELYTDDYYGGHLSEFANELVADKIINFIG
jgi:hypothetical protein